MENFNTLLTVNDVAAYLKVTPQYVRKLINTKKLIAARVSNQWIITQEHLELYKNENDLLIEPDDHERLDNNLPEIIALSFFSGAMGLDIGMKNEGISALLACEFNKFCRMTIEKNNPNIALIGDITKYTATEILKLAKIPAHKKVDVIFGGPPCQAFSTAGTRRALNDERGNVFLKFLDIAEEILPTYIVIENVRGLLSASYPYNNTGKPIKGGVLNFIINRLEKAGYTISFELYNSANFGAPQIRERLVIIGKLGVEKVPYLSPTHTENKEYDLPKWKTLGDALQDMEKSSQHYINFPEKRLKFYRLLTEGQYWKNLPFEIQQEAMGAKLKLGGGKTGFFRRLNFNKPSPTLVTNPTMPATDLCHPIEDRPLSVEEYAKIQQFPDDWIICGPILEQYRQIGNAVPIKLGEAIAKTIIADMKGNKLPQIAGFNYSRYKNTNDVSWKMSITQELNKLKEHNNRMEQLTIPFL